MTCIYNFPLTEICSPRFGVPVKGQPGRASDTPTYIVFHQVNMSMSDYDIETQVDISIKTKYGAIPRSLQFLINGYGAVHQYVQTADTAWGINDISGPVIPILGYDYNSINRKLIHIGFDLGGTTEQGVKTAINLACCLALQYNIPVTNFIPAFYINDNQDALKVVPPALIAGVQECINDGGVNPPTVTPTPPPTACCDENNLAIKALDVRVTALELWKVTVDATLQSLQEQINVLSGSIGSVSDTIVAFNNSIASLNAEIGDIKECVKKICPQFCNSFVCDPIRYQLMGELQKQLVTPNQPVRINAPTRLLDTTPPSVLPGPMWNAHLTCKCNREVVVTARVSASNWCAGKSIWIDMVSCIGRTRITSYVSDGSGNPVSLPVGKAILPSTDVCDVYFEIGTNDLTFKTLEFADIQIYCNG